MGYGLDGRGIGIRFPAGARDSLLRRMQTDTGAQSPIQWVPAAVSSGVKWPGREADHLPTSHTEVKHGAAISPLPHTSSWHMENFTFLQDVKDIEYRKKEKQRKKEK
jgi:hypothetical protein